MFRQVHKMQNILLEAVKEALKYVSAATPVLADALALYSALDNI